MIRQEIEQIRKNNAEIVQEICSRYGLYGNVFYYEPSPIEGSNMNRMYIVAGFDPAITRDTLPKKIRPDELVQERVRSDRLFYPRIWALDLLETKDELAATQALVEYCKKAEFLRRLYGEHNLSAPKIIRRSEVQQLMTFRQQLSNPVATARMQRKARKDLDWFFRREKTGNEFRRNWLNYFRSDKFPDNKGPIAKIVGFLRRKKNDAPLDQLMDTNKDISKLEMQEYEFKIFQHLMEERYPFVTYAIGDKEVIDHGINRATSQDDSPFGRCVTAEEYAVVRKDRFASEGWNCVANLKPAYWEFRDIYYKDCDEPLIASVYQHITLQYAKCDSLGELKQRGPMRMQNIPANDFMNFVSLAKARKLRFYIDSLGEYEKPSLETIHVLYNDYQQEKMDLVVEQMISDKVSYSHVLNTPSRPTLNSVIYEIEEKNRVVQPTRVQRKDRLQK